MGVLKGFINLTKYQCAVKKNYQIQPGPTTEALEVQDGSYHYATPLARPASSPLTTPERCEETKYKYFVTVLYLSIFLTTCYFHFRPFCTTIFTFYSSHFQNRLVTLGLTHLSEAFISDCHTL